jgi:hypothetical protein
VVETAPALVSALRKLQATVPEVTAPFAGHPMIAVGAAAEPRELVSWLGDVTRQLHEHPFGCPWLAGINQAGDELAGKLAGPLPPTWLGVRGFSLVVDDMSMRPTELTGHVLIAGDRVADLVASLAGTIPQFAGIPLVRDGRPIALPLQQLGIPVHSAHLALTTDRLVIAAGNNSAQQAAEYLSTPPPRRSPLAVMAFDMPRIQKLMTRFGQPQSSSFPSHLRDVGMSLDVVDTGITIDVWGSWADPTTPAPAPSAVQAQ